MSKVKIFSMVALALSGASYAAVTPYVTPSGARFELHDTACVGATRALLKEEFVNKFHHADIVLGGTRYKACWMGPDEDGDLIIINEGGQGMVVPMNRLKKVKVY